MSEQNKALGRRFVEEVITKKNLTVVDELVAPDMIEHNPLRGRGPAP